MHKVSDPCILQQKETPQYPLRFLYCKFTPLLPGVTFSDLHLGLVFRMSLEIALY